MTKIEQICIKCLSGQLEGIFVDKKGKYYQVHGVEDLRYVFLELKTDMIYYIDNVDLFVEAFFPKPSGIRFEQWIKLLRMTPKNWSDYQDKHLGEKKHIPVVGLPTLEMAAQLSAFSKLLCLYNDWIGGWKPDWTDKHSVKYCICYVFNFDTKEMKVSVKQGHVVNCAFAFPSEKMAKEFYDCFKSLFEQAKSLL